MSNTNKISTSTNSYNPQLSTNYTAPRPKRFKTVNLIKFICLIGNFQGKNFNSWKTTILLLPIGISHNFSREKGRIISLMLGRILKLMMTSNNFNKSRDNTHKGNRHVLATQDKGQIK